MMNSRATLISVIALFFSLNTFAARTATVKHADGTAASYKLLPVHFDASHAKVVEKRLKTATVRTDVPADYQIDHAKLPAMRDQGQRGTCVYFATVGMIESYLISKDPAAANTKVSEQCLVGVRNWEADTATYTGDDRPTDYRPDPDGDYLDRVAKTASYFGVPEAKKYSSVDCTYDGYGESPATSLDDYQGLFSSGESQAYIKSHQFDIDNAPTVEKIKATIASGVPVEIATLVYNDHFYTSDWSFDAMNDTDSNLAGGHAIILTGYKTETGHTVFTFKNSWGNWGSSGYGTIDSTLLEHSWKYDPTYDQTVSLHD